MNPMDTPVLTTMVVLVKTPYKMNTDVILNSLPIAYPLLKVEKQGVLRRGESSRDKIKRRVRTPEKRHTGFGHNSMTLVVLSKGDGSLREKEITVKLFQNGVFHITGVLDDLYDADAVSVILQMIREYCPDALTATEGETERRVVLMNYKTRLQGVESIAREKLYQDLMESGTKVAYEPSVYPAVKIYFPDQRWIAKVFRTGNIILTGMTTKQESVDLMQQLHPLLERALPTVSAE
jgi:TATA-box binding protein (TBP) (component of TFIID and TFIIIB)